LRDLRLQSPSAAIVDVEAPTHAFVVFLYVDRYDLGSILQNPFGSRFKSLRLDRPSCLQNKQVLKF